MFTSVRLCRAVPSTFKSAQFTSRRTFTASTFVRMPEALKQSEVSSQTDPSVAKQFDNETSTEDKFKDFYTLADGMKISMMSTYRNGVGPVSRSMAVSKRSGPDFLYLANKHSNKMTDLSQNKEVNITFHDSSKQDWISVTGEAVTTSSDDPRIKQIYSKIVSAWFGDLGDGVHTGGPEDPRMSLIEIKAKYISYYKSTTGKLSSMMEIGGAVMTGKVAQTGDLREMHEAEIKEARERDSKLSS